MQASKQQRHQAILGIVQRQKISSQEELRRRLYTQGHHVTQATLSRDLRDLNVIKVMDESLRQYQYQRLDLGPGSHFSHCDVSGNLLVLHTEAGLAPALAYHIDAISLDSIVGTVAGEDTVLAVVAEDQDAHTVRRQLCERLQKA